MPFYYNYIIIFPLVCQCFLDFLIYKSIDFFIIYGIIRAIRLGPYYWVHQNGGGCSFSFFRRKEINIFFAPFAINEKGVVPMNIRQHLKVTYDNYRRYISGRSIYSNYFASYETKVKEKDNRPRFNIAVIF